MVLYFLLVLLIITNSITGVLLFRGGRRLLQFDDIFQEILPELQNYSADLRKLSSGDLLLDHPEVVTFHKRNLRALKSLESIIDSVASVTPKQVKPLALPRPEVE